jgi:dTDP-4-amino-4,6-dideoxygalactose transaminase
MCEQPLLYVTRPSVPLLAEFAEAVRPALEQRRLTNGGPINHHLRLRLSEILRVPNLALVANGTLALEVGAKAIGLQNKVITTPFSFPATINALLWIGLKPVFADIDETYLTLDPGRVEAILNEDVSGLLGVHVYGNPCDVTAFDVLQEKYNLRILYDGAHCFGTSYNGFPLPHFGDATTLSFHATKLYNTAEGGAVCSRTADIHRRVELMSNFGIESEDNIAEIGINAKMSEIHAAFGLANLHAYANELTQRREVVSTYVDAFDGVTGIEIVPTRPGTSERLQYFVIRISRGRRDYVFNILREGGIFARRYFFPLLCDLEPVRRLVGRNIGPFPNAQRAATEVLALPLSGTMRRSDALRVVAATKRALA